MPKLIISKTFNFVLVWLNVFGRVKSVDYPAFENYYEYFCEDEANYNYPIPAKLRNKFLNNDKNVEIVDLEHDESILCQIGTYSQRTYVDFEKRSGLTIEERTTLSLADDAIKLKNIQDDTIISLTRLLSERGSKLFFEQSIALDTATTNEGTAYTQYILVSENSEKKVKKFTLIKKAPSKPDLIVVFKKDHLNSNRIIAFSAATLEDTQINYATAQKVYCNKDSFKSKSGSHNVRTEIKDAINGEISKLGFKCLKYDDGVMTESKDRCPTNPQTNHSFKINYKDAERTITIYNSTFNTSVCFELGWEEFEWKTLWTILIVGIAIVVFVILVGVCWRKKKCCFQESNTAPPSPQGENPMSVARFQNHQSNDRHNGANRPAVEVQADQEDIVLSRVSVGPIDEDEYARENEVQPDHVDEEYVSDSESQKNDGSESQKNDV